MTDMEWNTFCMDMCPNIYSRSQLTKLFKEESVFRSSRRTFATSSHTRWQDTWAEIFIAAKEALEFTK